jgi:hypothetical protein
MCSKLLIVWAFVLVVIWFTMLPARDTPQGTRQGAVAYCCKADTEQTTLQNTVKETPGVVGNSTPSPLYVPWSAVTQSTNTENHELNLLPNLLDSGAVSDGRTYSIALISAYQNKIPPATELFVQGIIVGQAGPGALTISDEQDQEKTLVCSMSSKEFQDVNFLYHAGGRVQAYGAYVTASNGVQLLRNCRVSDPTDNVVRLGTVQASKTEPQSGAPPETAAPGERTASDNPASIRKAAEQGYAPAQNDLGASYYHGQGNPQDFAQAVYWFRKAAEHGNTVAQNNLGASYYAGHGVPQDYAQAAYWYRKAAEQGYVASQANLSASYYNGQGVPQDYAEAYFWMALAASSGKIEGLGHPENLAKLRGDAASHLTPAELTQVQERVRKWTEEHPTKAE